MAAASPFVLFAPASGPGVGGGHVMRCLALAEALQARGARCVFAVTAEGEAMLARFAKLAFETFPLAQAALEARCADMRPDALVLDDYASATAQEIKLKRTVRRLIVIDDLATRTHPADLLIDPGQGRLAGDYDGRLPVDARRMVGSSYALLRPAFAAFRHQSLSRPIDRRAGRLFISFGLSDVQAIAARATMAVRAAFPHAHLDVALAASADSLAALRNQAVKDERLHLHVDATNVAALMAQADFAVGAGGGGVWERACLGLPSVAVIVADNQRPSVEALARDGALLAVGLEEADFESIFTTALQRLRDPGIRKTIREKSSQLCDGLGADRVAAAILDLV